MVRKKSPPKHDINRLRVPPSSVEAEQAVIGGLLLSPAALDIVSELLAEEDFFRRDHRLIYRGIRELAEKNKPFDAVTLGHWFEANVLSEQIGGNHYLVELASTTPSAANIRAYAEIVADKSALRRLIETSTTILGDAFTPDGRAASEIISKAEQSIFKLNENGKKGRETVVPINDAMSDAFRILQDRYEAGGSITGIPSGFHDLDAITSGLQPSDLIIVAARPAMGKTSFAMGLAEHAALHHKKTVAVFSMEMSSPQLALRMISSVGRVNAQSLKNGQLDDTDWPKVSNAIKSISEAKIFLDDTPAISPEELRGRARRIKREHGLDMLVVDYLQLMEVPGNKEGRTNVISEISRSLKALAKELNIPIIALSQLNRSLESRADKRPMMSDLRESGGIEQDADLIIFIYRDEYYHKDSADKGLAEIIIAKHRNGPTDTVKLKFFGEYTLFASLGNASGTFE